MRRRCRVWCVCLLAWMIGCSAMAEGRYDELCSGTAVVKTDVAAWIEIPGAEFCKPVMRHAQDDGFYADHDASGADSILGSLYVQGSYNTAGFDDPAVVVYGSSKLEGAPFRDLQEIFSGSFDQCREILLHLPGEKLRYEVFAAVPYSSIHILYYYDFGIEHRYEGFFDGVYSTRMLGMHLDPAGRPEFGERVLILSTGIRGDNMQRYLVMAKLLDDAGTQTEK